MAKKQNWHARHKRKPGPRKPGSGAKKKVLNVDKIVELMKTGHTVEYIAIEVGCSPPTLYNREEFRDALERGRVLRNSPLQVRQYALAMAGHSGMLIWLGKQWLGQSDKLEQKGKTNPMVEILQELRKGHNNEPPEGFIPRQDDGNDNKE